jgi:hypothetical protein
MWIVSRVAPANISPFAPGRRLRERATSDTIASTVEQGERRIDPDLQDVGLVPNTGTIGECLLGGAQE